MGNLCGSGNLLPKLGTQKFMVSFLCLPPFVQIVFTEIDGQDYTRIVYKRGIL